MELERKEKETETVSSLFVFRKRRKENKGMLQILLFTVLSIMYMVLAYEIAPFIAGYIAGMLSAIVVYKRFGNVESVTDMLESKGRFEGLDIVKYMFKESYWSVLYFVFWPVACIIEGIIASRRFLMDTAYFSQ